MIHTQNAVLREVSALYLVDNTSARSKKKSHFPHLIEAKNNSKKLSFTILAQSSYSEDWIEWDSKKNSPLQLRKKLKEKKRKGRNCRRAGEGRGANNWGKKWKKRKGKKKRRWGRNCWGIKKSSRGCARWEWRGKVKNFWLKFLF